MKKMNLKKELALRNSKGFTLIELLVVVAIIGILSSVVLASLNTARVKGQTAAFKAEMSNVRTQMLIVCDGVADGTSKPLGTGSTYPATNVTCKSDGTMAVTITPIPGKGGSCTGTATVNESTITYAPAC